MLAVPNFWDFCLNLPNSWPLAGNYNRKQVMNLRVRFGYVAMALGIKEGSPNKTVTVSNLMKIDRPEDRLNRLRRLLAANLEIQLRVLRYNSAHAVHVFRFTSRLVPLATHPAAASWNYLTEFQAEWKELGEYVRRHNMRVSAHPDHFTLLNSPDPTVLAASLADLGYHAGLFDAMGLGPEAKLVLHVGGKYNDKAQALDRFAANYRQLPLPIRERIVIENDDRTFTVQDVLALCQRVGAPMVLDIHHHRCCNQKEDLTRLLPGIFATWGGLTPKIHVSSPKDEKNARAHADYIELDDFHRFLDIAATLDRDFDVMVEAKQKDAALFRLVDELEGVPGVRRVEHSTIEYNTTPRI